MDKGNNTLKNVFQNSLQSVRKWVLGDDIGSRQTEKEAVSSESGTKDFEGMSRQKILDAICAEFERGMHRLTTKHSLLFPFGYCIFLNPKDFNYFRQTFAKDADDAAKELRYRIDSIVKRNANYSQFIPLSTMWQFMFLPFTDGQVLCADGMGSDELRELPEGQCKVISTPLIEDLTVEHDDEDGCTVLTVAAPTTTNIQKIVINPDALKDVDIISNYCFRVDYHQHRAAPSVQRTRDKATATLLIEMNQFVRNDGELTGEYQMRSSRLKISGQNASSMDGGVPVVRINSTHILSPHISLRHDPNAGLFFITAHGNDVMLNGSPLKVGEETMMPSDSVFSIGWTNIHFKAL